MTATPPRNLLAYTVTHDDGSGPREERWPPTAVGDERSMQRWLELCSNPACEPTRRLVYEGDA